MSPLIAPPLSDVGRAGHQRAVGVVERHADHELGLAVAVDVAGGQRPAGLVAFLAVDAEAVGAERAERHGAGVVLPLTT